MPHGHQHHHHNHTQIGYNGGGPRWYYCRRCPVAWIAAIVVFTLLIIVSATVTVRYTAIPDYTTDGLHYAPTDTRIIPVSNAFCQNLELTVDSRLIGYTASLSMLDSRPRLTGNETFSINETADFGGGDDPYYYYYYFYPGSSFSLSVCISDGTGLGTFSLRGHKNFNKWVNNYHVAPKDSFVIDALCNAGQNNARTYHIQDEDYYYLVYDSLYSMELNINVTFDRTRYEIADNSSANSSCSVYVSIYGDSCSVSVPLSGKTAFLTITPWAGTDVDLTDRIGLDIKCVPRVWIALSIFTGLVAIVMPLLACIIIKLRKNRKTVAVADDKAPLLVSPPANPYLQQPTYGSNYKSPPVYKP